MPNKRRAGQTFIGIQIDVGLAAELDRARGRKDRSQFVREAIAEKLKRMKIRVPESLIYPPPRAKVVSMPMVAEEAPKYRARKKEAK